MPNGHGGGPKTGLYVVLVLAALLLVVFILFMIGAFSSAPPEAQSPEIPVNLERPTSP